MGQVREWAFTNEGVDEREEVRHFKVFP